MEDGLTPIASSISVPLQSLPDQTASTAREVDPATTTLQKRSTFS